jgi:hypothetical protein
MKMQRSNTLHVSTKSKPSNHCANTRNKTKKNTKSNFAKCSKPKALIDYHTPTKTRNITHHVIRKIPRHLMQ